MAKCIIFVEGGRNTDNGNLRQGFQKLLEQEKRLSGKMPEIKMSDDTAEAIRKFKSENGNPHSIYGCILLLVDLDGPEESQDMWLNKYGLQNCRQQVFWMIQEMEAWFISQPKMLTLFYEPKLSHALPPTTPAGIRSPADKLEDCTKRHPRKGTYAKVKHGAQLLKMLRLDTLRADFPDVERLVSALITCGHSTTRALS